jgi:hypothetical protein
LPHDLGAGAHTLTIHARDEYGRDHWEHAVLEIVAG